MFVGSNKSIKAYESFDINCDAFARFTNLYGTGKIQTGESRYVLQAGCNLFEERKPP